MGKRLAATVMKCGQKRVYIDPTEVNEVKLANSRKNIRKLVKDHIIEKRKTAVHSRFRVKAWHAAVRKGRHTGTGRRKGARNARMPSQILWLRRSLLPSPDRCTSEPRVTCTRTRTSSSSPSTRIRLTRSVNESSRPRE